LASVPPWKKLKARNNMSDAVNTRVCQRIERLFEKAKQISKVKFGSEEPFASALKKQHDKVMAERPKKRG